MIKTFINFLALYFIYLQKEVSHSTWIPALMLPSYSIIDWSSLSSFFNYCLYLHLPYGSLVDYFYAVIYGKHVSCYHIVRVFSHYLRSSSRLNSIFEQLIRFSFELILLEIKYMNIGKASRITNSEDWVLDLFISNLNFLCYL